MPPPPQPTQPEQPPQQKPPRQSRKKKQPAKKPGGDVDDDDDEEYLVSEEDDDDDIMIDLTGGGGGDDDEFVPGAEEEFDEEDLMPLEDEYDEQDLIEMEEEMREPKKGRSKVVKTAKPARSKKPQRGLVVPRKKRPAAAQFIAGSGSDEEEADIDLEDQYNSEAEVEEGAYVLGAEDEQFYDFSDLQLKPDHANRPLWVCPDGRIFLETFSPVYKQAYDFLIAVSEPVSRPESIHEYVLTPHSLYAAVSIGLETSTIVSVLDRLSKARLPTEIKRFIRASTENYGKVKLVFQKNAFLVESPYPEVLKKLLRDETMRKARVVGGGGGGRGSGAKAAKAGGRGEEEFVRGKALKDQAVDALAAVQDIDLTGEEEYNEMELEAAREAERVMGAAGGAGGAGGGQGSTPQNTKTTTTNATLPTQATAVLGHESIVEDPDKETHSFEIQASQVEHVKARCLPGGLNYPMLEEYDFRGDTTNPTIHFELKPHVRQRPYQEKSLSKMFGNSRARSGIIVLPCGAGKSLVGVTAAARIRKSCLCLCTNAVSVDQWKYQFQLWTTLRDDQVCRFTADKHEWFQGSGAGVCITTYTMIAYSGRRSEESERIMNDIMSREWGLILLDEVHVVPAQMFRRVLGIVKAHCKLGLTATLVREDQLITDLNFLIGPKLYEANWLDLTKAGHIANVQCAEVWCPMTREFMREYRKKERTTGQKQLLYVMNPSKVQACQYLVQYHEARGDKVIVFSDNLFALREYAVRMKKPFLYGGTGHQERTRVLHAFKTNSRVNTVFLSKIGDNSLDIPEANVLIQISSHGGSRRQEAQRLGRILRKKKTRTNIIGSGNSDDEFDAFFYTLVSNDTQEVYFTAKRQQFLIDQGYAYKVIPSLLGDHGTAASTNGLLLSKHEDQLDLLAAVLHATEADAANEELPVDGLRDDAKKKKKSSVASRRVVGSMAALSGGQGLKYLEYKTGGGKRGVGGGGKLAKLARR